MGEREQAGNPMNMPDGQIAAIALANGYTIATRNIKDFKNCGLDLINPFYCVKNFITAESSYCGFGVVFTEGDIASDVLNHLLSEIVKGI